MTSTFTSTLCLTQSSAKKFGLCDEESDGMSTVREDDGHLWRATVLNNSLTSARYYAIDKCEDIIEYIPKDAKRCDGLLSFNEQAILIELKHRNDTTYFIDGKKQIKSTLNFIKDADKALYDKIVAVYVCNDLRPRASLQRSNSLEEFHLEYGVILRDRATIDLDQLI